MAKDQSNPPAQLITLEMARAAGQAHGETAFTAMVSLEISEESLKVAMAAWRSAGFTSACLDEAEAAARAAYQGSSAGGWAGEARRVLRVWFALAVPISITAAVENAPRVIPERTGEAEVVRRGESRPCGGPGVRIGAGRGGRRIVNAYPKGVDPPLLRRLAPDLPRRLVLPHPLERRLPRPLPLRAHWVNSTSQTSFGSAHLAKDTAKSM